MGKRTILNSKHLEITLKRLASQLKENHQNFENTVLIGLQPRGIHVLERLKSILEKDLGKDLVCGQLDITFYRDDFRRREQPLIPSVTNIDFIIEDKRVVLIDDVLYTGRSIRSGLDALLAFGRPKSVELLILIDRQFERHLPIQADYIGKQVNTLPSEVVVVEWEQLDGEDMVILTEIENG
ncbi:MAG: bifunctional pyr operon transcriptional regulator/uracil phosphoribosyltransferase PyrR [Crocinitomicaceae bacterium]|nr:bifunctional pyr operon transcriptional regulator/uracil phosphoribosyltransferase PyrR [Crocinitomicaceae bacterium]